MHHEIKEGALFISDAHDKEDRKGFYEFLLKLDSNPSLPPQLFLMGDMFELLVGGVDYTTSLFKETIDVLNRLSTKIEIFYFEGNHDFNLAKIFPDIKVFPISAQPILFHIGDKKLLLSHGDSFSGFSYTIYTAIIRNIFVVKLLNFIDSKTKNSISKKILSLHNDKNICYKIPHFDKIIKQKIQKYDIGITEIDFICEGHHHQNQKFVFETLKYINFSSFACDKSYFQLTFKEKINFKELF
jgi:UDP-2,3-diacylglucosamine hydrolase